MIMGVVLQFKTVVYTHYHVNGFCTLAWYYCNVMVMAQ